MHSIRQETTVGKCKTKAVQTDLGIFTHIPSYSRIFWHICLNIPGYVQSGIIRHSQAYSGIIQAYSELWCIQNTGVFRTRGIFRTLAHSEPRAYSELSQTSAMELSRSLLYAINIIILFNAGLIFTPKVFILWKKSMRNERAGNRAFWYTFTFTAFHKRKRTIMELYF